MSSGIRSQLDFILSDGAEASVRGGPGAGGQGGGGVTAVAKFQRTTDGCWQMLVVAI